ncbi:MAG: protein-disulfide reductase DsbD domain-containing protein, partial [Aestuariivirga sp.]
AGSTNTAAVDVGFPVPRRFNDEGGETIGYHDRVLFPIFVKPANINDPVNLQLNMFFAVCKEVCIPARANADLLLNASLENPALNDWQQRVPKALATGTAPPVTAVRLETRQTKPMLVLSLSQEVQDIFVESETTAYFGKPQFDLAPQEAWLPIGNLKDMQKLRGAVLKLTLSFGDSGVEQTLVIA